jgi:hypothetical protein
LSFALQVIQLAEYMVAAAAAWKLFACEADLTSEFYAYCTAGDSACRGHGSSSSSSMEAIRP